jgi:ATP-binding cassette subfamily F protein 3
MLGLSNVTKSQGGRVLYTGGSFTALPGDKIGLVGPNGAGKTTIFRILTGESLVDHGQVIKSSQMILGYFSQDIGEMQGSTVLSETMSGIKDLTALQAEIVEMESQFATPMSDDAMEKLLERYGEAQAFFEARGGYDLDVRAQQILGGLGFSAGDFHRPVEHFSGGWKMRIALAKILLLRPEGLLMDEPTNHLDLESIMWLEEWLASYSGILILTSHDRTFMNRVINKVVEIANGTITTYAGNYDFYLREREIRKEQVIAAYRRQQEMLSKEARLHGVILEVGW